MIYRIGNLFWKEVVQFVRDRLMTAFIFSLPLLQMVLMAQATGHRIGGLRVAVLDLDHSAISRQLTTALDNREELTVHTFVQDEAQLRDLLDRGQAEAGVIFPRNLEQDLISLSRPARVQVVVNGENSVVGSVALSAANGALAEFSQERLETLGNEFVSPIDLRVVTYYNPAYDTRPFTIPAQVGFITYQITLAVASLGLARERELGTLEQLIVTPLSRLELVLGKAIPALLAGMLNFVFMTSVAIHFFHIPMRGSLQLLFAITIPFVLSEIGWGVLISGAARTQQQAILFVFILAIVDITFSGYLVPVKNLPGVLREIAQVVPMYHYLIVIRGIMLKGSTLRTLWPHALALIGLAATFLGISVRGVSRRLD